jgi:hypothetical protein
MDDMLAVRTLAERLLSLPHDSDAEAEPARVLPGALPDDLPCPVPIPEGVTVIGSVSYPPVQSAYDQRGRRVTILFDTPLQPEDVMAYYHGRLCADGWVDRSKDVETARATAGGFRFVDPPRRMGRLFCRSEQGPALWVFAAATRDADTQVHLEVDMTTRHSPCRTPPQPPSHWQPPLSLPTLRYPADATPVAGTWGTAGSSAQSAHAAAIVRTGHDLAALTAHIEEQLAAAGWTRERGGIEGALAWSVWSVADAHGFPWRGVLYIAWRPDQENQFMLHLAADYMGEA